MIKIRGYTADEKIYESSQSLVFRGRENKSNDSVIIKILKKDFPSTQDIAKFKREYEILKKLNESTIIKVKNFVRHLNTYALIMEDINGTSLGNVIKNDSLSIEQKFDISIQIAEAIKQVHDNNLIHKDINPANIIINLKNNQLKIIDFGISTEIHNEEPKEIHLDKIEGTLNYISPEQTGKVNRILDYRCDMYSFGITLYELFSRRLPFQGEDYIEIIHCHLAKIPVPLIELDNSIPKNLSRIVEKLISKNAENRYHSFIGIISDLKKCLDYYQNRKDKYSFKLGIDDVQNKLYITQKLYGREKELFLLKEAFDNSARGNFNFILLEGSSGIGKTKLINEFYESLLQHQVFFLTGKFEKNQVNNPFSAFLSSFKLFINQILSENRKTIDYWREHLLTNLAAKVNVITELIPDLELIFDNQNQIEKISNNEALNQFIYVFEEFLKTFATNKIPLVLVLEDLQWIDPSSLKLLTGLLNKDCAYLLIISSLRKNELSDDHILNELLFKLSKIEQKSECITNIHLGPLSFNEAENLTAETLSSKNSRVTKLTSHIMEKTHGNPLFIKQFLNILYENQNLIYDVQENKWVWDINSIIHRDYSENIAKMMTNKIYKLTKDAQNILEIASCIGYKFNFYILQQISRLSVKDLFSILKEILINEIIKPLDDKYKYVNNDFNKNQLETIYFRFIHDKVQLFLQHNLTGEKLIELHYRIGQILLINRTKEIEKLFEILEHLNQSNSKINTKSSRIELILLNLIAGKRAKDTLIYPSALNYFKKALELLEDDSWSELYELSFEIYFSYIETLYLLCSYTEAEETIQIVSKYCKQKIEKVELNILRTKINAVKGQFNANFEILKKSLKLYNIDLPDLQDKKKIKALLEQNYTYYKRNILGLRIRELADLALLENKEIESILYIISSTIDSLYFINNKYHNLLAVICLNLMLEYGLSSKYSPMLMISISVYFGSINDYKSSNEYGNLALHLNNKFNYPYEWKILVGKAATSHHWGSPLKENLLLNDKAYNLSVENADHLFAGYALSSNLRIHFLLGQTSLDKLLQLASNDLHYLNKIQFYPMLYIHQLLIYNIERLIDIDCNEEELNETFKVFQVLELMDKSEFYMFRAVYHIFEVFHLFLFENYEEALVESLKANDKISFVKGMFHEVDLNFYSSLAITQSYNGLDNDKLQLLHKNQEQMKDWVQLNPENFLSRYLIIKAEMARLDKDEISAMKIYKEAVDLARENKFLHIEAIANELAGKFYLSIGFEDFAGDFIKQAHYLYDIWGAKKKANQLENKYKSILLIDFKEMGLFNKSSNNRDRTENTINTSSIAIDLQSIAKASQTLSKELDLEQLIQKLLKIIIENSGAEKAFLLLEENSKWVVKGEYSKGSVEYDESIQGKKNSLASDEIINYVVNSKNKFILDQNSKNQFPWINQSHLAKSLLCLPLLSQYKLSAILYLENDLMENVFSGDNLEILNIIASQAAISLENAKLFKKQTEINFLLNNLNTKIHNSVKNKVDAVRNNLSILMGTDTEPSNSVEALDNMNKLLCHCSEKSKNILYVINNKEIFLENLIEEIEFKLEMSLFMSKINYLFNKKHCPDNTSINPKVAQCILDLFSEILNNIIKHSKADKVKVLCFYNEHTKKIFFKIIDNGIGFDYNKAVNKRQSYGLSILNSIAMESNAKLKFETKPKKGCSISIEIENK